MSQTQVLITDITTYLYYLHVKYADGCKGSCGEREVGYHNSDFGESFWYARFGGYCIGNMSRHVEIKADSLDELLPKIKVAVEESLKELE